MKTEKGRRWFQPLWAPLAASVLALTGCGNFFVPPDNSGGGGDNGGGGGTGTARVYVANKTTGTISGFTIGDGTLTQVPNSPVSLGFNPLAAVVSTNNAFLYVAGPSSINVFAINSDGSLTQANNGAVISVASLDVSPDGKWLFGLDLLSDAVDEFQIDSSSGGITLAATTPYNFQQGATVTPQMIKVSPLGNLVFVALGSAGDSVLTFDTTSGTLTATTQWLTVSSSTSDNALAVNSTGSYLYIARSGTNGGVAVYTIGSGGVLNAISGSPFATGSGPFSVTLDTTGKYLYVANRGDGTISGYTIGTGSALTAISGSPFANGASDSQVNSLGVEPSGKYLFAGAGNGPDLSMYSFDATTAGQLDLVKSVATDTDPAGVAAIAVTH